jgi:WD40 repeat protein
LWDLETGKIIHRFTSHVGGIWALDISPDGQIAVSAADDSILIFWDLETGQEIRRLEARLGGASGVSFSPDSRRVIFASPAGTIEWDLETGQQINRFQAHPGTGAAGRTRVAYLPDGKTILSSGWDGTLALWNLETGREIRRFRGHDGYIYDIAISPDGRTALSGATDRAIIQWDLNTPTLDELTAWIETNRYVRELTCEERETYQIEPFCETEGVTSTIAP